MILLDFNQVAINGIQGYASQNKEFTPKILEHIILNSLRFYIQKFKTQFPGKIIIACDSKTYWRKQFFPYYKAKRKIKRESSTLPWPLIYQSLDKIKEDIKSHFPYYLLEIENTEADDIIAVLSKKYSTQGMNSEPVLIISSDRDFKQLQIYPNIKQFSPKTNLFLKENNPSQFLLHEIIKGQSKDSIPNILSNDNQIVENIRQKPITKKILEQNHNENPNFYRNKTLIDFNSIPQNIQNNIIETFNSTTKKSKSDLMKYIIKFHPKFIDSINDF